MPATAPVRRLTEAEYLELKRKAEMKHELFDGELFASVEFQSASVRPSSV
jgi:hypothetical protein